MMSEWIKPLDLYQFKILKYKINFFINSKFEFDPSKQNDPYTSVMKMIYALSIFFNNIRDFWK